ncbi:enoyl-CoA hydratase/isomerase family protein [Aeromicrobium sp. UC242_57]|uniref:enoyl-CoA hydratase/isomerase family protein n=1 Tax=Aeromicrobium sp. UC242_57 TaxID=3374624 RepID=UPI00379E2F6B
MLTGRRFDADEAHRIGLLTELVAPRAVVDAAIAKAEQILLNAPLSVELTKTGMWAAVETASFDLTIEFENRQQMVASFTDDRAEATAAFLEKRPPVYRRR